MNLVATEEKSKEEKRITTTTEKEKAVVAVVVDLRMIPETDPAVDSAYPSPEKQPLQPHQSWHTCCDLIIPHATAPIENGVWNNELSMRTRQQMMIMPVYRARYLSKLSRKLSRIAL